MSSPPETDREYAYFRVTGMGDAGAIDKAMNLSGAEYWNVGDEYERRSRVFKRKSSAWHLDSGFQDTDDLDKHIEALLELLKTKADILNTIKAEYRLQIVCVSFVYQSFSYELPFNLQKIATDLGISFWFDSYSFGDLHEEIMELRGQQETEK